MVVAIKVPDLGTTVDEVKLVAWLVEEGEQVKRGDLLAEIETDKATTELESVAEGTLLKQVMSAGETAAKGDILAYVGKPGETLPETETPAASPQANAPRVSPMVRNLARKLDVALSQVQGTGRGGMITREDVQNAVKESSSKAASGEPLSRAQAAVAKSVLTSVQTIPHLRVTASIDMAAAQQLREKAKSAGKKISYDAIFLKALANAIQTVPLVAARLENNRVTRPDGIHIALAVGSANDLFLPVIRDIGEKDISSLQEDIQKIASQAKVSALKPEDMTGGCMTLSNLGMYPIESFDAIIFPEHSAILAVGATQKKPVVINERVEILPVALATLAVDHRLINGRTAAEFLTKVKETLESGAIA